MTSTSQILDALQFDQFRNAAPLNTTGDAPYVISFRFGGTSEPVGFSHSGFFTGFTAYSAAEKAYVREGLAILESFLNVDFQEVTGAGDVALDFVRIDFAGNTVGRGGFSVATYDNWQTLTNWDGFAAYTNDRAVTSFDMGIVLHEIAHAMGLAHPFDAAPGDRLPPAQENNKYTVMSYTPNPDTGSRGETLGLFDLVAMQDIWGAAVSHAGDTVHSRDAGLIWDTGGTDTITAGAGAGRLHIDLRAGAFSSLGATDNVVIGFGVVIENATGNRHADVLRGNAVANDLVAKGGDDRLFGLGGGDRLIAGSGDDLARGGGGRDVVNGGVGNDRVFGDGGDDRVYGSAGNDLVRGGAGADVVGGGAGRDRLHGDAGRDRLFGGGGNDTLFGGGDRDVLRGGKGNDLLFGQGDRDRFVFFAGEGRDRIKDFEAGIDTIDINGYGTPAAVKGYAARADGNVVFSFADGDALIVENATLAETFAALI